MKNIVLIGMSGSGKSTVGKYIAEEMNMEFLDTDDIIVSNIGKDINYIFNNYGESYFREIEKLIISTLSKKSNLIIATVGGVVLNSINIERLKKTSSIFFLNGSLETLYNNIKSSKGSNGQRPLLDKANLKESIEKIYNARKDLYLSSGNYIISIDGKTVEKVGNEIITIFKENNPCP